MVIFMFDGIFLSKLQKELSIIKSGRISKIIESADNEFITFLFSNLFKNSFYK